MRLPPLLHLVALNVPEAANDFADSTRPAVDAVDALVPPFRRIYDDYFAFVWSCTRRLGVPADAMDDVVQEIFLIVHSRLRTLQRPASLRSWIYGIIRRSVSGYHRRRRLRASQDLVVSTDYAQDRVEEPSPLELTMLSAELQLFFRILSQLDDRKREVLLLADLEEMPVPEIAEAIGIPLNTAYSRLRLARLEFREAFSRHFAREPSAT